MLSFVRNLVAVATRLSRTSLFALAMGIIMAACSPHLMQLPGGKDTDTAEIDTEDTAGGDTDDSDTAETDVPPCTDVDGDHWCVEDGDCNDSNAAVHPGGTEVCNGLDDNCDGTVDEDAADATTWYKDNDGDGYGVYSDYITACNQPTGYVENDGDCDDSSLAYHPGAPETDCTDENDYNCDGYVGYEDNDRDGWAACEECNDADGFVNPLAYEECDGYDNDCDGYVDESSAIDASTWYRDLDSDSYGDEDYVQVSCAAPSGYVSNDNDCDDSRSLSHPGATEYCNGYDDDCDGSVDEDSAVDVSTWYYDWDNDGYGTTSRSTVTCDAPAGYVSDSTDCDDTDPDYHPSASETDCSDPNDYNCDGVTEYADTDGDGWAACEECDDTDADVYPGATEYCNSADDDCDGSIDEGATDGTIYYRDADGDGYGDAGNTSLSCSLPAGYVANSTDCDDTRSLSNPGAVEYCNGLDDDCDGTVDEDSAIDASTWYRDSDRDGYGDSSSTDSACDAPSGYTDDRTDCDDDEASTHPDATEVCDTIDNDCDGRVDEGCSSSLPECDADNDPTGAVISTCSCDDNGGRLDDLAVSSLIVPDGYCDGFDKDGDGQSIIGLVDSTGWYAGGSTSRWDCLEVIPSSQTVEANGLTAADVHSYSTDRAYDGVDQDCNAGDRTDVDDDGYNATEEVAQAEADANGYSLDSDFLPGGDCDEGNDAVNPDATEDCDGSVDEDCDGLIDEGFDTDGDSWGACGGTDWPSTAAEITEASDGECHDWNEDGILNCGGDCDDDDADIHPWAEEVPGDGDDNDCSGGDESLADADRDGYDSDVDCNDAVATTHPSASEMANWVDDDCDTRTDEGCTTGCGGAYWDGCLDDFRSFYTTGSLTYVCTGSESIPAGH